MKKIYESVLCSVFLLSNFSTCCMKKVIEKVPPRKKSENIHVKYDKNISLNNLKHKTITKNIFPFLNAKELITRISLINKKCNALVKQHVVHKTHEDFVDNKNCITNYCKHILKDNFDYLIYFANIKKLNMLIEKRLKKDLVVPIAYRFSKKSLFFDITKKNNKLFKKKFCDALKKEYTSLVKSRNKKIIFPLRFTTTISFFKPPIEILRIITAIIIKEAYRYATEEKIKTKSIKDASMVIYLQVLKFFVSKQQSKFNSLAKDMELETWIPSIVYFVTYWYAMIRKGYRLPYFKSKMQECPQNLKNLGYISLKGLTYYIFTKIPIDYAQKFLEDYTGTSKRKLNQKISALNKKIENAIFSTNQ
ncbi:hypothetical protein ACFLYU_01520 [Candidatus Dependentiae bacterium]